MKENNEKARVEGKKSTINFLKGGLGTFVSRRLLRLTRKAIKGNWNHAAVIAQLLYWEEKDEYLWKLRTIEALSEQLEMPYITTIRIVNKLKKFGFVIAEPKGKHTVLKLNLEKLEEAIREMMPEEIENVNYQNDSYPDTDNYQNDSYQNDNYQNDSYAPTLNYHFDSCPSNVNYQNDSCHTPQSIDAQGIAKPLDYIFYMRLLGDKIINLAPLKTFEKFSEPVKPGKLGNLLNWDQIPQILWNLKFDPLNPFNLETQNQMVPVCKENKKVKTEMENCAADPHLSDQPVSQTRPVNPVETVNPAPTVNPFGPLPTFRAGDYISNDLLTKLPSMIEEVKGREGGELFLNELKALGWNDLEDTYPNRQALQTLPSYLGGFEATARALQEFRKILPDFRINYPIVNEGYWIDLANYVFKVLSYRALKETLCSELNLPDKPDRDVIYTLYDVLNALGNTKAGKSSFWLIGEFAKRYPEVKCKSLDDRETFRKLIDWINGWCIQKELGIDFSRFDSVIKVFEYCVDEGFSMATVKEVLFGWYYYTQPKDINENEIEGMIKDFDFLKRKLIAERFKRRLYLENSTYKPNPTNQTHLTYQPTQTYSYNYGYRSQVKQTTPDLPPVSKR
jgi:hypothetical protein